LSSFAAVGVELDGQPGGFESPFDRGGDLRVALDQQQLHCAAPTLQQRAAPPAARRAHGVPHILNLT
jgi:hypothetical protein